MFPIEIFTIQIPISPTIELPKKTKKQTITRIHCKNDENFIWSWEIKNGSYRVGLYWKQLLLEWTINLKELLEPTNPCNSKVNRYNKFSF